MGEEHNIKYVYCLTHKIHIIEFIGEQILLLIMLKNKGGICTLEKSVMDTKRQGDDYCTPS